MEACPSDILIIGEENSELVLLKVVFSNCKHTLSRTIYCKLYNSHVKTLLSIMHLDVTVGTNIYFLDLLDLLVFLMDPLDFLLSNTAASYK